MSVLHTVQLSGVGYRAQAIAVNPTTNTVYVALTPISLPKLFITVIDGATNSAETNVTVGGKVYAMAANPVTNLVYLAEKFAYHCFIQVLNGSTDGIIANVSLGTSQGCAPTGIAVDPATDMVYVTNYDSSTTATSGFANTVSVIDGKTNAVVANITGIYSVYINPEEIAVNPITNMIYVVNHIGYGVISVINGTTDKVVANVNSETTEGPVAVNPSTNRIYFTNYLLPGAGSTVYVIDGASNKVVGNVSVGPSPFSLAVDPTTDVIYVICLRYVTIAGGGIKPNGEAVVAVDGFRDTILTNLTIGEENPLVDLALNPTTNIVYLAGSLDELSVVSGVSSSTPTSSATSSGNGGIPEFPVQFGFALLVAVVIVASYVAARRTMLPQLRSA